MEIPKLKYVLVLYTGGTIGMKQDSQGESQPFMHSIDF